MINFTVGPVQSSEAVRAIGSEQVPYFRTSEFSDVMFENERLIKKFAKASDDSKVVFLTASGSGAMETAVMNTLTPNDKALVSMVAVLGNALWSCWNFTIFHIQISNWSMVRL